MKMKLKLLAREKRFEPLIFSFGDCCLAIGPLSHNGAEYQIRTDVDIKSAAYKTAPINHYGNSALFMVGNVGFEPLFLTPNQVCYHYTTFPKLNTANKEDLLNLLAGAKGLSRMPTAC